MSKFYEVVMAGGGGGGASGAELLSRRRAGRVAVLKEILRAAVAKPSRYAGRRTFASLHPQLVTMYG